MTKYEFVTENAEGVLDRVVDRMKVDRRTGCFEFTGGLTAQGYGQLNVKGKQLSIHRAIYMILVGGIPEKFDIHHICEVKACFNPDHLEALARGEHIKETHKRINAGLFFFFRCGHLKEGNISYHRTSHAGIRCRQCHREGRA